jgi:hypothetical protein
MPPKEKPTAAKKTAAKKQNKDDKITLLPAIKLPAISTFSIKVADPLTISYYADGAHNYAKVVICVNRTVEYSEYEVGVVKDGHLILFVHTIHARLFNKKVLKIITKDDYRKSCACVIAWNNTVQEMEAKKVHSKYGLFWGQAAGSIPQVEVHGHTHCHEKHDYLTECKVCDMHGKWHTQCNCIVIITVQSAENQVRAELEVKSSIVDHFEINSSQNQDTPPSPPPRCRKRYLEERHQMNEDDMTVGMTTEAEASEARNMAAAAVAEGSAREVFRVGVSTLLHSNIFYFSITCYL